jgi:hypothetical protein
MSRFCDVNVSAEGYPDDCLNLEQTVTDTTPLLLHPVPGINEKEAM